MWKIFEKAGLATLTVVALIVIGAVSFIFVRQVTGDPIGRPDFMLANVHVSCSPDDRKTLQKLVAVLSAPADGGESSADLIRNLRTHLATLKDRDNSALVPADNFIKQKSADYIMLDKFAHSVAPKKDFRSYFGPHWIAYYRTVDAEADEIQVAVPTMYGDKNHHTTRLFGIGQFTSKNNAEVDALGNAVSPTAQLIFQVDFRPTVPHYFMQTADITVHIDWNGPCRITPE
jgi:hypothetical protein